MTYTNLMLWGNMKFCSSLCFRNLISYFTQYVCLLKKMSMFLCLNYHFVKHPPPEVTWQSLMLILFCIGFPICILSIYQITYWYNLEHQNVWIYLFPCWNIFILVIWEENWFYLKPFEWNFKHLYIPITPPIVQY